MTASEKNEDGFLHCFEFVWQKPTHLNFLKECQYEAFISKLQLSAALRGLKVDCPELSLSLSFSYGKLSLLHSVRDVNDTNTFLLVLTARGHFGEFLKHN